MDVELKIKPNYKTLGKDFGNMTSRIIELVNQNAGQIANHLKQDRSFKVEEFELTSNHVIVERICPVGYDMTPIRGGLVFVNKKITKELELEGYAREVTRRIQQLRKDSELNKRDVIELNINSNLDLKPFEHIIKEKVGAKRITFGHSTTSFTFDTKETIKGKEFHIMFNKL